MNGRGSGESPGMMQCPIGHPPGPQAFCPICGRQCLPVESAAANRPPEPVEPPEPTQPPAETPAAPPVEAAEPGDRGDTDAPGSAAAKARDLIAQLSAGTAGEPAAPTIPSQGPARPPGGGATPVTPYLPGDTAAPSFPSAESPAPFERTSMAGLGFPTADTPGAGERAPGSGQWATAGPPAAEPPPPTDGDGAHARRPNRLLPILLLLAALLVGGYLVKTQLLDSDSDQSAQPSVKASVQASAPASPAPSAAVSPAPTPVPSYTSAQLAAELKNPHFKHGYDAGKARASRSGGVVAPADRESVCRTMAFAERAKGYPWGQHDQVGCLVALSRG